MKKNEGKEATPPLQGSSSFHLIVPNTSATLKQPNVLYLGRDVPFHVEIKDDKKFYQDATFWLSLLAIGVSLWTLFAANSSGAKARRQSINDEFWLRNVLYPLSIGPALEFYSKIVNELPPDRFDPLATSTAISTFKQSFDINHSSILAKAIPLGVLG
ncbi:MAG: hypothetical protein C0490_28490, partial [Marivirga sp.]|nr:hypothetical protein [Marivirga sp.]